MEIFGAAMKKFLLFTTIMILGVNFASADVFDSNQSPVEVKLAPAIKNTSVSNNSVPAVSATTIQNNGIKTIKVQKFNNALVNLDDAQVELRQELAVTTAKYDDALKEKERAIANCKNLKKEIKEINKKMKNVDKSKKMINKNLEKET